MYSKRLSLRFPKKIVNEAIAVNLVKKFDLAPLRHMCSVGEPLNAEGVLWGREAFGLDFHDTFWQTETGAMVVTNLPGMPVKPGSMGRPFPALEAAIVNGETGKPIEEPGEVGMIAVRPPWPSLMRTYWNNTPTYYSKFLNGWYICGDRGSIDADYSAIRHCLYAGPGHDRKWIGNLVVELYPVASAA